MVGKPQPTWVSDDTPVADLLDMSDRFRANLIYERAILECMKLENGLGMYETTRDQERRIRAIEMMDTRTQEWIGTLRMSEAFRRVMQ